MNQVLTEEEEALFCLSFYTAAAAASLQPPRCSRGAFPGRRKHFEHSIFLWFVWFLSQSEQKSAHHEKVNLVIGLEKHFFPLGSTYFPLLTTLVNSSFFFYYLLTTHPPISPSSDLVTTCTHPVLLTTYLLMTHQPFTYVFTIYMPLLTQQPLIYSLTTKVCCQLIWGSSITSCGGCCHFYGGENHTYLLVIHSSQLSEFSPDVLHIPL